MRHWTLVLAVVVAGCMPQSNLRPPESPEEERAREAARKMFAQWNESLAKGDAQATYVGMSCALRSDWLWRRMQDKVDSITPPHMDKLDADALLVLGKWSSINEGHTKRTGSRATRLPESFLTSQWLFELYAAHFESVKAFAIGQAKMRKVVETYADQSGVTIITDSAGHKELYELIVEGDGFKVNMSREPQ